MAKHSYVEIRVLTCAEEFMGKFVAQQGISDVTDFKDLRRALNSEFQLH